MVIIPFRCTAIGCIRQAPENSAFCETHYKAINPLLKGELKAKAADGGADFKKGRFSREFKAAVFKSQTNVGLKDGRISRELIGRREWVLEHEILGKPRIRAPEPAPEPLL